MLDPAVPDNLESRHGHIGYPLRICSTTPPPHDFRSQASLQGHSPAAASSSRPPHQAPSELGNKYAGAAQHAARRADRCGRWDEKTWWPEKKENGRFTHGMEPTDGSLGKTHPPSREGRRSRGRGRRRKLRLARSCAPWDVFREMDRTISSQKCHVVPYPNFTKKGLA